MKINRKIKLALVIMLMLSISGIFLNNNINAKRNEAYSEVNNNVFKKVSTSNAVTLAKNYSKFIRVNNKKLVDGAGKEFQIKGIAFGNNVWYNPTTAPITHHDEKSYKELSDLGFNSVRFYINYSLFEDDKKPYIYKKSGFQWLDQNVKWAKKYGIKLIINMHVPQGGFISTTNVEFWQNSNMNRFLALWKAIAKRYSNEATILGYGLINEPYMPYYEKPEDALNLYYNFIDKTINEIRKIDKNHIIFIERPYGLVNKTTKAVTYPWGDYGSFKKVNDKNVVYEYHFYDKIEFTAQKLSWYKTFRDWYYNDDSRVIMSGKREWKQAIDFPSITLSKTNEWVTLSSNLQVKNTANTGFWYLKVKNSNKNNNIYVDDIVIKEFDSNGKYIKDIYKYDFSNITYCDGWDLGTGGGGTYSYDKNNGSSPNGCAKISNVGNVYKIHISYNDNNIFRVKDGYNYQITAKVKSEKESIDVTLGIQMQQVEKLFTMNKEFLEYKLKQYMEWADKNNVPIYLGEFGVTRHIMGNEFKGEEWVKDMFSLLIKYKLNYNYHDYHEENYGLYIEDGRQERKNVNKILYNIFLSEVKK